MADKRSDSGNSQRSKSAKSAKSSVADAVKKLTIKALEGFNLSEVEVHNTQTELLDPDQADENTENENVQHLSPVEVHYTLNNDALDEHDHDDEDNVGGDDDEEVDDSGMEMGLASESDDDIGRNNEEPDSDLIVLDPDHPLMKRFQKAYKDYLEKQDGKMTLELRELQHEHSNYLKQHEEVGVELYGIQQELARQQLLLEKHHDHYNEQNQTRAYWEMRRSETKGLHKQVYNDLQHQRKKAIDMQNEVENLAAKVLYMEAAKEDVRSDISILKRAADKAETEVVKAQIDKQRQDMLVNKLVTRVDRLRGEIAMYNAQIEAQRNEMKAANRNLTEAVTELEAIELEKKQLLQQWNNSLIGMRRRDEAFAAIQEAVNIQNQQITAIENESDGYKKQISKAQERNENLTYMHNRIESDILSVKKQTGISLNKQEALKIEYSKYSRALRETEHQLNKARTDLNLRESELVTLRRTIEKEFSDKQKLEDQIMSKMQEQLTADKASHYTKKMTDNIRRKATKTERAVVDVENLITKDILEIANSITRGRSLQDILNNIQNVIYQKNDTISKIENEIVKRNAVIEKKQGTIDQMNKKIVALINKNGDDVFVGPLELQIKTLQRQIELTSNECLELQQYWLRQQNDLVKIIKEVNDEATEVDSKKKRSTILLQKKLRIEGEINSQKNEIKDIERKIRNMQNDMTKLNHLIHKNRGKQETLQQDNILMENDFVGSLKDAELESVHLQTNIQGLNEEKERLLNALVEAERQIMLWEKKTQLAREVRNAVDSDMGQGEIQAMKAEIHRMEMRYAQLMRQQEKMMQDMERSVFKRESIIVRGDAMAKAERKRTGKPKLNVGTCHKKMTELKKKIKQTNQDATSYEEEIKLLRDQQRELSSTLEEKQSDTQKLQQSIDLQCGDIERMVELKQMNLSNIINKQQRGKYYIALKSGKYSRLCRTPSALNNEKEKQNEKLHIMSTILDRILDEYPEIQTAFRGLALSIGNVEELDTTRSSVKEIELVA